MTTSHSIFGMYCCAIQHSGFCLLSDYRVYPTVVFAKVYCRARHHFVERDSHGTDPSIVLTFPIISGSMADMASRRDEVLTESALTKNTPAAGRRIAECRRNE